MKKLVCSEITVAPYGLTRSLMVDWTVEPSLLTSAVEKLQAGVPVL